MKKLLLLLLATPLWSQLPNPKQLSFDEYLGYVKKFHPRVKSADLNLNEGQAQLLLARGAFDPKIEVDFNQKQFAGKEYYSLLNSSFKIPTWYGVEVKAAFDNSEGIYINPENVTPRAGLTSLGVTVPLGQGLWINERMADLRKAKIQLNLSKAEQKLEAIAVLHEAALAYFNWKRTHDEVRLYADYLENAQIRFKGIRRLIENGDKPAIDSIEASIAVRNRQLSLTDAQLKQTKARLELSTFLWLDNNLPLELQDDVQPEENLSQTIAETLHTHELLTAGLSLENHPKITALQSKLNLLEVDRKLKANSLLPKANIGYHYLSEPDFGTSPQWNNYKLGLDFSFPVFLRKQRGSLKLAKIKLQDAQNELDWERLKLSNKIKAQQTEINALEQQRKLTSELVRDNQLMLQSEERLFGFGESSLFLLNTRENNLVSVRLSAIALENRYWAAQAELFKIMADPDKI